MCRIWNQKGTAQTHFHKRRRKHKRAVVAVVAVAVAAVVVAVLAAVAVVTAAARGREVRGTAACAIPNSDFHAHGNNKRPKISSGDGLEAEFAKFDQ